MADSSTIEEWNITLSPFTSVFNRTITLPHNIGPGLGAINNTTLIAVNGATTPKSVVTLDITTSAAVSTYIFDMIADRNVAGDILLTTTNKVLVTTYSNIPPYDSYISQYSYPDGTLEVDIQISPTVDNPWGIFQSNSEIYLMNGTSSNNVYHINKNSPYALTLTGDTGYSVYGASQVPSCITTNFIIAPTPSPTPTNTITPTITPTPTTTPVCNCYEIANTGATSGFWRMILCSATTQTITFAPPGFSTSTCIGGSNYTGSTQMSFVLKGECSDNKCLTPTPTPSVTPTISLTPTITPTKTVTPTTTIITPTPTSSPISLTTYYGYWSYYSTSSSVCPPVTLSALTISTASTFNVFSNIIVSFLDGSPINNLSVTYSTSATTITVRTNSNSTLIGVFGCEDDPTPTTCTSNQYTITNNTNNTITVNNVTSPFTSVSLPQFNLSAYTSLIVCSCTTPTSSGGSVTNNGVCPYL
jgi:hypothetical protein